MAPEGCPSEATVRGRLDQVLASIDPQRRQALQLQASARVTRRGPQRFSLDLEITTSEGASARHIDASTCEELVDATTLLISMVDPAAAAEAENLGALEARPLAPLEPEPEPEPEPDPEPEPEPEQLATPTENPPGPPASTSPGERVAQRDRPTPPQALLGLDLNLGRAALPSFGAGVELRLGLLRRHLRGELFARYQLPRSQTLTGLDTIDATVRYGLGAGGLRACGLGELGARIELFGCLGAELGAMHGEGINLPVSAAHTGLWAAALITPGAALRLTRRLALVLRGDLGVALARPRFAVRNYGDAHRAPPLSFVLGLGLEVRLPGRPANRAKPTFRDGSTDARAIPPGAP